MSETTISITAPVSTRGTVIIPKVIREYLNLPKFGGPVSFKIIDDKVILERVVVDKQ
jgi:bifunctional DNA-binding transcriptional regulator/antitoxin component of YhaV-PrlF toxin-antitoxin module